MRKLRSLLSFLLLGSAVALVTAEGSNVTKWQTLGGDAPLVIARGGFSGLFPDSSSYAYRFVAVVSLPNTALWCDVQLSKDGVGFCLPDLWLGNSTDTISNLIKKSTYLKRRRRRNKKIQTPSTYRVNGVSVTEFFFIDYTINQLLQKINLEQGISSRSPYFDGNFNPIMLVENVFFLLKPPASLWLNIEHDAFYSQHNLSMKSYIVSISRTVIIDYISSPEVNFLMSIGNRFKTRATKLVFRFLAHDDIEPTTNQTYGSLLKNLMFIKTFASGILVPKGYIWPVDSNQYLLPSSTSLVLDAHKQGLEVYASEFANDVNFAYNFSYDPIAEYLSFMDNGQFSVDGFLTDNPITPSQAIDCYSHAGKNDTVQVKLLIISSEGASGVYPGCTDLAYNRAISDGVDIIDCPVQMTQDGVPICLGSINLIDRTTAAQSPFINVAVDVPELNIKGGIPTYNLTWSQIQTLQPSMYNMFQEYSLYRNPDFKNAGKLVQLSEFLTIANNASSVTGVMISIENAFYLKQNQGLDVVDAVLDTLNKFGFTSQTSKKVMIESTDSSVLKKIALTDNYELVYRLNEDVSAIKYSSILDINKFATSVVIGKESVFPTDELILIGETEVVSTLQAFNLSVYVQLFSNEFVSQAWDFFSNAYVEVNTYVRSKGINGVITGYPATSDKYRRNRCLGYNVTPSYMDVVQPGGLITVMSPSDLPPAEAPNPEANVVKPSLPPVVVTTATGPSSMENVNGHEIVVASTLLTTLAIFLAFLVLYL